MSIKFGYFTNNIRITRKMLSTSILHISIRMNCAV